MSKKRRQYIYNLQLSDSEASLNVKDRTHTSFQYQVVANIK